MDLLDRLLAHDAWTTRRLLELCQTHPDAHLDREFDLGRRTLRDTFEHIIRNMEVWTALMEGQAIDSAPAPASRPEVGELIRRLDEAAAALSALSRSIRDRDAWDETWLDTMDDPPREKTYGGAIAHLLTHSMHHRAQILFMMRRLGIKNVPEGDVLSWEHREGR